MVKPGFSANVTGVRSTISRSRSSPASSGTLLTSTASQAGFASQMAALVGVGLDAEWFRGHPARLAEVTVEQVAEAAMEFFTPTAFTGVIVGDADLLGKRLAAMGGVEA